MWGDGEGILEKENDKCRIHKDETLGFKQRM